MGDLKVAGLVDVVRYPKKDQLMRKVGLGFFKEIKGER